MFLAMLQLLTSPVVISFNRVAVMTALLVPRFSVDEDISAMSAWGLLANRFRRREQDALPG